MARSFRLAGSALLVLFSFFWAVSAQAQSERDSPAPIAVAADNRAARSSPQAPSPPAELKGEPERVGPYGISALTPEPLLSPEPYRLERPNTSVGWFATLDLGLVKPHVTSRITSGAAIGPVIAAPFELPVVPLSWAASPRLEAGYRLPEGHGDVRLAYHFLASFGTESSPGSELKSRLDLNVLDLDYVSSEWLAESWCGSLRDLRLVFGARLATSYLDSYGRGGAVSEAHFSSHFVGAGPHFGLEWSKPLPSCPVEIYTRFDAAGLVGRAQQSFAQLGTVRREVSQSNGAETIYTEIGLGWRPGWWERSHVVVGYRLEQWWDLGRVDDSSFAATVQGVFLRAEWRY